jgi:hypothetical protein
MSTVGLFILGGAVDFRKNGVWVFGAFSIVATLASATAIARPRFVGVIFVDPAAIAGTLLSFGGLFSCRHRLGGSLQEWINAQAMNLGRLLDTVYFLRNSLTVGISGSIAANVRAYSVALFLIPASRAA